MFEKITPADKAALESVKQGSDWRLQDGADYLMRIVINRNGEGSENESSIFNPKNAHYILREGCKGIE